MRFPKRRGVFDPLDLEIIDQVYETAWAQLEAREPLRDREKDADRERALRKLVFALATPGIVDFDTSLRQSAGQYAGTSDAFAKTSRG